jgi:hypothetical protein
MERIGRSIGGRFEFFPQAVFFPTVQDKTGLTSFPNRSDRFHPVGCREGILSKEVSVALWLLLFRCGKDLEVFWVSGEFLDKVGLTGFPCLREAKSNRSGLTGLGCQQPCRVCFRCVCYGCWLSLGPRFSSTSVATWTWQEKLAEVHE